MTTTYDLISRALRASGEARELPEEPRKGLCCVIGEIRDTVAARHLLTDSFTERERFRAGESDRVSVECWDTLTHARERTSSWFCDGNSFRLLNRLEVRGLVLGGPRCEGEWSAYATTSYKKHGALHTPVNSGRRAKWRFETVTVDCSDLGAVGEHWQRLFSVRVAGVPRACIESFRISPYAISKLGVRDWLAFERWATPRWRTPLYQFLTYLLPSQEEIEGGLV